MTEANTQTMGKMMFSSQEIRDIFYAAEERGISPEQLVHDAVVDNLVR